MADKLDIIRTCSNLKNRMDVMSGKFIQFEDWIEELGVQVILLTKICRQQQEEIETLKDDVNILKSRTGRIG